MKQFSQIIALLENANHYYIICTDLQGNYSYINQKYANRFSHVDPDFVGKPFHITMHPEDVAGVTAAGQKCLMNSSMLVPDMIRKHDGQGGYIITQWEFKGMYDDSGNPEGVFCLGYDITDFIERLDKKDDLIKAISFTQSHVIRRPVANILGVIEILKQYDIPEESKAMLEILFENTTQLDGVIRQITDDIYKGTLTA